MDQRRRAILLAVNVACDFMINNIFDNDSESSSDDSDAELDRRGYVQLRGRCQIPTRIRDYVEVTVPTLTRNQFREQFRLTWPTYETLEGRFAPFLQGPVGFKRHIPVRKQLLATLWLLATPDSYRSVAERFDMSKSSLNVSFMRVVESLCHLAPTVIVWPRGNKLEEVKAKFQRLSVLPDIIGAIDGSHINIKEPIEDKLSYKTYKRTYAIILQAVWDAELVFTDIFSGYPGSVGDLRILRNSDLWQNIHENRINFFPNQEYIIGDKAYPILTWCPFRDDGHLTDQQRRFNTVLSSVRQVIERAFALLKGRFRRLKYLDMNRLDMVPFVLLACAVLHNIRLEGLDENVEDLIAEGQDEQAEQPENVLPNNEVIPDEAGGVARRNYFVTLIE